MLTGQIKKPEDIPEGDFRRSLPRFSKENFSKNLELVHKLEKFAKQKGCTPAQLAISV
jgi:pyridoxine 4-dehydrogenase